MGCFFCLLAILILMAILTGIFSKRQIRANQSRTDYPCCEELMSRCAECEVLDSPFGRLPCVEEWFAHCFGER